MSRAPYVLILIGVLLALGNLGLVTGPWIAPVFLIGIGCLMLLSPRWRERQRQREERRAEHAEHPE
jgi:Flp pilus assembly protein TadB